MLMSFLFHQAVGQEVPQAIEKQVQDHLESSKNIGLVIVLVEKDNLIVSGFGETEKGLGEAPDANTIFEIGDITKVFTTSLLSQFAADGKAQIDDKVQGYLPNHVQMPTYQDIICSRQPLNADLDRNEPDFYYISCEPDPNSEPVCVTLCNLASHSSGLPSGPKYLYKEVAKPEPPYTSYTTKDLYDQLPYYTLKSPPGEEFLYSDLGIALLGHLLSIQDGASFEQTLKESILAPIGMNDTRIDIKQDELKRMAKGYSRKGKLTDYWNYDVMQPAGGLKSTGADMAKFLQTNLGINDSPQFFSFSACHEPRLEADYKKFENTQVGMGWFITTDGNSKFIWQDGKTGGFSSFIGFEKTLQTGVVILSNSKNSVTELGMNILKLQVTNQ